MLRLTVLSKTKEETVLKVEGWVSGENVALLEEEGAPLLEAGKHLVLDLKGVQFIDETGIALLRRWQGERLVLRGASLFVQTVLERRGLAQACDGSR